MFRSRNHGTTWLNADVGLFLGAALCLTIDPKTPEHLLLGTDTGLLESKNGGRNWTPVASGKLFGSVFAVQFSPEGTHALLATPGAVFRLGPDGDPQPVEAPTEAAPARAIAFGPDSKRTYLLGRRDVFVSDDSGQRWRKLVTDIEGQPEVLELQLGTAPNETLFIVADGKVMASSDAGKQWQVRMNGIGEAHAQGLSIDPHVLGRIWVSSADRIYLSEDNAATWKPKGAPLSEADTSVRAIVADPSANTIVIATHKGLVGSTTGGNEWALIEDNLPVHLDSRVLMHDRSAPGTLYAGFGLMPYAELWRIAIEGGNLLSRIDPVSLAGGLAALALILLFGVILARRLMRVGNATKTTTRSL